MPPSPDSCAVVVTSIAAPNDVMRRLAELSQRRNCRFFVIGDVKSPAHFELEGCDFYSLDRQSRLDFRLARLLRTRSYARKNLGYLLGMQPGCEWLIETDDDNMPNETFLAPRQLNVSGDSVSSRGWVNAYAYFTPEFIYPRGFPLEAVQSATKPLPPRGPRTVLPSPIQQFLTDGNPDVDAVYRMLCKLPLTFDRNPSILLGQNAWCPFNSQTTVFLKCAFPLMYLPTFCTFRMTDVWRSFVAQRILWTCGWHLSFHAAIAFQQRNEHNLLRDFEDEIPGYLGNALIAETLENLDLKPGPERIGENLLRCYEALVKLGKVGADELPLAQAWLDDLAALPKGVTH